MITLDGTSGITAPALDSDGSLTIGTAVMAVPTGDAPLFAARAWVNFNGQGTVSIRSSGNVSSIVDNGAGDYTINFTTAMPDANYSIVANASIDYNVSNLASPGINGVTAEVAPTASAFNLYIATVLQVAFDPKYVNVAIFR
jgi:hypothetical protein